MRIPAAVVRRRVRRQKRKRAIRAKLLRSAVRNMRKDFLRWRGRQLRHEIHRMWIADGRRDESGRIHNRGGKFTRGVLAWLN